MNGANEWMNLYGMNTEVERTQQSSPKAPALNAGLNAFTNGREEKREKRAFAFIFLTFLTKTKNVFYIVREISY